MYKMNLPNETKGSGNNVPVDFEEAVSETGFGKYNITLLVLCGISLMSVIIETLSMSFIVPAAKCDLNLTLEDKGILSSVGFMGVVISSLLWGFIGDTNGRRKVVLITSYISFLACIASSLAPSVWLLVLLRFINCFFIGGPSAAVIAYLGEFHGMKYRARVITLSATFVAIGSIILPGLAWIILPMEWSVPIPALNITWRPWRLLIILYGLPSFIAATWLLFMPESPKYLWAMGKNDEALIVLQKLYTINTGKDEHYYPVNQLLPCTENVYRDIEKNEEVSTSGGSDIWSFFKLIKQQLLPIFCPPLLWRIFMTSLLQFGTFAASSGMLMWLPEILNKVAIYLEENETGEVTVCKSFEYNQILINNTININETITLILSDNISSSGCTDAINEQVYIISLIIGGASACTFIFIGITISYTGKKRLLAGILIVTGIAGVVTQFMETYLLIALVCGLFIIGGAGVTILNTVVVDLFPTQYRSIAMAVSLMFGRTGAMVASHAIGYLLEYSCSSVFYIFGCEYIFLGLFALLLPSS